MMYYCDDLEFMFEMILHIGPLGYFMVIFALRLVCQRAQDSELIQERVGALQAKRCLISLAVSPTGSKATSL